MYKAIFVGLLMLCPGGCGSSAPPTYLVGGTVTFDGKPVKEGDIIFVSLKPEWGPDAGKIIDGKYSLRSKAGKCRVEIRALDIRPDTPVVMNVPVASNFIPARYNDESELTVEVTSGEKNVFDFSLRSGGGSPAKSHP